MYKRLRIIVPAVQVLIVVVIVLSEKFVINDRLYHTYVAPTYVLVWKLNFPYHVFLLALDRALRPIPSISGTPFTVIVAVLAVMLLLMLALFWYFVVTEIKMRSQGKSMLQFTGRISELFTVTVLFCFGVGSIWSAYSDTSWSLKWHQAGIENAAGS